MFSWFYDGPVSAVYYLDSDNVFGPAYRWRSTTGDSYGHGTVKGPPRCKGQYGGQGRYTPRMASFYPYRTTISTHLCLRSGSF
jgi:hypothetical protein